MKGFKMITRYTSPKVSEPAPKLWSNCIVCDGIAYIAGLTSRNADGMTIDGNDEYEPVSYTHLTLPTNREV